MPLASPPMSQDRGFTVMELMIVVLIITVLLMIAVPGYKTYLDKERTFEAEKDVAAASSLIVNYWQDARAFPDSLADVNMSGLKDPWGRPYVYYNIDKNGKGHARKDHALNPLNTDFDLYSVGPNGQSKSQITQRESLDDIIRARDGAFIGVAADF